MQPSGTRGIRLLLLPVQFLVLRFFELSSGTAHQMLRSLVWWLWNLGSLSCLRKDPHGKFRAGEEPRAPCWCRGLGYCIRLVSWSVSWKFVCLFSVGISCWQVLKMPYWWHTSTLKGGTRSLDAAREVDLVLSWAELHVPALPTLFPRHRGR